MFARISIVFSLLSLCSSRTVNFALYQLDDMAMCELGWPFSDYKYYGCACSGVLRQAAVDQVDECCERHNQCYDAAAVECGMMSPYYAYYSYKCDNHKTTCKDSIFTCTGMICNCDKQMMDCLQEYPRPTTMPRCHVSMKPVLGHQNRTHPE
ncbi:hypothetical protein PFISCL1PPCAC_16034 [Pristionchus fissidentatus]|uniref:Phospholipase A2 n=1 Tax=Pristionchus fissidentatus TaxID=1538716 RepID=A0AAV5W195_9BILA|nr:hypothetical protein PFISCL1PPCAC_16034 [Pristionchus fissidentatus]